MAWSWQYILQTVLNEDFSTPVKHLLAIAFFFLTEFILDKEIYICANELWLKWTLFVLCILIPPLIYLFWIEACKVYKKMTERNEDSSGHSENYNESNERSNNDEKCCFSKKCEAFLNLFFLVLLWWSVLLLDGKYIQCVCSTSNETTTLGNMKGNPCSERCKGVSQVSGYCLMFLLSIAMLIYICIKVKNHKNPLDTQDEQGELNCSSGDRPRMTIPEISPGSGTSDVTSGTSDDLRLPILA